MTSGQLRKRGAAFGMMVTVATILAISLQLTGFNPVAAITARLDNDNIQPVANATPREPMIDTGLSFDSMSPAEALSNGRPTLFFFQPYELCQSRYCGQPQTMADAVQAHYQDDVNFVYVMAYERAAGDHVADDALLLFDNWDVYTVPPYSEWLPQPTITESGLGLKGPVALLIDQYGYQIAQSNEYFNLAEFESELDDLLIRSDG
jgi:hypothetical protein